VSGRERFAGYGCPCPRRIHAAFRGTLANLLDHLLNEPLSSPALTLRVSAGEVFEEGFGLAHPAHHPAGNTALAGWACFHERAGWASRKAACAALPELSACGLYVFSTFT
jgi:hypothetical protein